MQLLSNTYLYIYILRERSDFLSRAQFNAFVHIYMLYIYIFMFAYVHIHPYIYIYIQSPPEKEAAN